MNIKAKVIYIGLLVLCWVLTAQAQQLDVKGKVTDTKGEPLLGVFVQVKGTPRGTTTNPDGEYEIKAAVGNVLQFSFLGMKTEERKLTANTTQLNVVLKDEVQELEGTIVTGYGKRKVASRTVAQIAQVQGKDFAETPNANILDALQGRVAGLVINTASGRPGETTESSVRIHGINSFTAAAGDGNGSITEPLYIVDGVPVTSDIMVTMNPADVENISVLKDAASTSIYGARAANGVILITTKRGRRNERTSITINHQLGFSALTNTSRKFFDGLVTPEEYMDFWVKKDPDEVSRIGNSIDGVTTDDAATAAAKILRKYPYHTRWDKEFYRDFVPLSRTDVSVAGGSKSTSYYFSFGYLNQEGTKKGSDYERYNLNVNLDTQITQWLRTGLSVTLAHSDAQTSGGGSGANILSLPLYSPTDENGNRKDYFFSILTLPDPDSRMGFYHPNYLIEKNPGTTQTDELLPTGFITIEPIKNLTFKTQAGIQYNVQDVLQKSPLPSFIDYETGAPTVASTQRSNSKFIQTTYTNLLEYTFEAGTHHYFNVLLGQESVQAVRKGYQGASMGQPTDGLSLLSHGNAERRVSDTKTVYTFNSYFARLEYNYANKYFIDVSGRRDGSSAFGRNNGYANFWAVGAMWKLKEEAFLNDVKWLNELNLRVSTGISGNTNIGSYRNRTLFNANRQYKGNTGFFTQSLGNPDIAWEEQQKTSIGLSAIILRNTSLTVEWYDRQIYNLLATRPLNSMSGYRTFPDNIGDMQNRGVDVTLSSLAYRNKDNTFSVRPYFNLNYNAEKVLALRYGQPYYLDGNMGYRLGGAVEYALPIFKGINNSGAAEWYQPNTDNPMITQTDDSKVTTQHSDALAQSTGKKVAPPVNGGFGWGIRYKDFDLDMSFSYSLGKYIINTDKLTTHNPDNFGGNNFSREVLSYWQQAGDDTEYPRLESNRFVNLDTRLLEEASYLRLKNISLGYTLPQKVLDQLKFVRALRLYASARNILTLTKYTGADPEMDYDGIVGGGYPPSRQFTFGVELKF